MITASLKSKAQSIANIKRYTNGEKFGFQKGHCGFRTKESYIKSGRKISKAMKGKKLPEKVKDKIRKKVLKQFENGMPENTKLKISLAHKGKHQKEKNCSWKGGITPINKLIRNSKGFKEWREKIYKRENYTCWICKEKGCKLNAHHLKGFAKYPKLRFEVNNGIILCEFCHRTYTEFGGFKKRKEK